MPAIALQVDVPGYPSKIPAVLVMLKDKLLGAARPLSSAPPPLPPPVHTDYLSSPSGLTDQWPVLMSLAFIVVVCVHPAGRGLESEGIFRLAPDKDECDAIKRKVRNGGGTASSP